MRKLLFVFALVATLACEDSEEFGDYDAGYHGCGDAGPECGEWLFSCEENVLFQCLGGQWVLQENCTESDGECTSDEWHGACVI